MSITSMVKDAQKKLDTEWKAKYPNGMFLLSVLKKKYRTQTYDDCGNNHRVVAEVVTRRPTSHSRSSHGLILGQPGLVACPWVLASNYNRVTYGSFAELKTAITEIVFPVEDIKVLEAWYKRRYPNARY
jgi:hypothetical protein